MHVCVCLHDSNKCVHACANNFVDLYSLGVPQEVAFKAEIDRLKGYIRESQDEERNMREYLQGQVKELKDKADSYKTEIENLNCAIDGLRGELNAALECQEARVNKLQYKADSEKRELEARIDELNTDRAGLINEFNAERAQLEKVVDDLGAKAKGLEEMLKRLVAAARVKAKVKTEDRKEKVSFVDLGKRLNDSGCEVDVLIVIEDDDAPRNKRPRGARKSC